MKTKIRKLMVGFVLLALTACTQEDVPSPQTDSLPMGVSAEIAGVTATRAGAELSHLQKNGFVFNAVPQSEAENVGEYTYKNIEVKYDADNSSWQFYESDADVGQETFLWMDKTTAVDFSALYAPNPLSLNTDQRVDENYNANDWLHFNKSYSYNETTNGKVPIAFQHLNSKLTINLTTNEGVEPKGVTITGTKITAASYNVQTGIWGELSGDETITANGSDKTYEAILLPQIVETLSVQVTTESGKTYTWSRANVEFKSGYSYTLDLKLLDSVTLLSPKTKATLTFTVIGATAV